MADFVPESNELFFNWQANLLATATPEATRWGIPAESLSALRNLQTPYAAAYAKITNRGTRTAVDVQAHEDARRAYEAALRQFVKEHLAANSAVSDAQRVQLGITVRDAERTPRPAIQDAPFLSMAAEAGARIKVASRREADSSRPSMHPDANALELRYQVGGTQPADPKDCTRTEMSAKSTAIIENDIADAGKRMWLYGRYANTSDRAKSGPWSKMETCIITD